MEKKQTKKLYYLIYRVVISVRLPVMKSNILNLRPPLRILNEDVAIAFCLIFKKYYRLFNYL